ncbi:rab3 GTPase-activating protein catalytic subunit-like isoform X2 [Salvia divinorum]|uniref:Rab3 GTPase-activating protein catalytic subunit n=1 Tax=Salvia divinorum TaxID=28513 RepID=A0ABD1GDZ3_SALDI
MKSANNSKGVMEDNDEEEEFEHFDDFTLASSWERFISEIEAVCRQWFADGPKNLLEKGAVQVNQLKDLYTIKSEFKYATKSYCMEYYFTTVDDGKTLDWDHALHDLQLSFGVKEFVVIAPQSASGVVLDAPEASKLLSAVAIALSNCSCLWPAFVPVHDSSRKAYIGIQNMGTVFTRRFEADRIASQVPVKLMHLEGLYELFVSKFAYTAVDWSMNHFEVHFKMKLTYRTPIHDDEDEIHDPDADITGSSENPEGEMHGKAQWDDNFPWSKWYSAEDPVNGFELLAIWSEITAESSLDMAELENASPVEADKWFLSPCLSEYLDVSDGSTIGFASQLHLLVKALEMSSEAKFIEDFISVFANSGSEALKSSAVVPPQTVLDRVLKNLFHEVAETEINSSPTEHKNSRSIKGAPQESLFAQFCLHALWFGNCSIRAISVLWIEFVREVRWCWEESQSLPRMPSSGPIDLSTCLINQKLHMLAVCIDQKHREAEGQFVDANDSMSSQEDLQSPTHNSSSHGASKEVSDRKDESSDAANVAKPMMLLKSHKIMHAPITLEPPPMTEDMHEERLKAAVALGDSYSFSAQLETEILASDMSAFKAANPDAVFEDFIRWHSPRDWENDENEENGASESSSWPPRGKLSERMSDLGNSWRKIWNEAPAVPASEQKPLWDPNREGEKVLHYLETLRPYQLLEEMVCAAFRAAADTLNRTSFGDLKQMNIKMDQLCITIASVLRIFLAQNTTTDTELLEDLRRLSTTFEHIEKLVLLAASLHVKFLQSPYLGQAIFTDCFNFYLPNMGTSSANAHNDTQREFDKKQQIRSGDRDLIVSMFPPPTANQSWRRVLSMGNLLNGHEPILREIIFSKRDRASRSYYAASSPKLHQQDIETYRMYVSGTSNDLGVALAVASFD